MHYLQERRAALGGYLPARNSTAPPLVVPPLEAFSALLEGTRGPRDLHHHGAGADPHHARQGQEHRQAHRADRARRGAHLRHGGHVPPDRHLFIGGTAVHAAGCRPADVLPRGQAGADPRGGHQRGGQPVLVDRRGDRLCEPRRQHGAVLHLLFDVRLPAGRRFHLGGGRQPGARLPDRRHRGPHHARGRGPAASGRPQPAGGDHGAELRRLRSDLCLRARGDRAGRHAAHVPGPGERLLLHHLHERELRASGDAGRRRAGHLERACTCCRSAAAARCA